MKGISIFYKIFKIALIIADIFLAGVISILLVNTYLAKEGFVTAFILSFIFVLFFAIIEVFLLKYYKNIVISV